MNVMTDNSNFEEPLPQNIKKLSSLSHRSEKRSFDRKKIARNISSSKNESDSNLFDDMGKFMVSKLQLCERKFTTEKLPKGRVIQRLGQFWKNFERPEIRINWFKEWFFWLRKRIPHVNNLIFSFKNSWKE